MIPILVKSDDVRSGRKAKVRHGRHRGQWVNNVSAQEHALSKHTHILIFRVMAVRDIKL